MTLLKNVKMKRFFYIFNSSSPHFSADILSTPASRVEPAVRNVFQIVPLSTRVYSPSCHRNTRPPPLPPDPLTPRRLAAEKARTSPRTPRFRLWAGGKQLAGYPLHPEWKSGATRGVVALSRRFVAARSATLNRPTSALARDGAMVVAAALAIIVYCWTAGPVASPAASARE